MNLFPPLHRRFDPDAGTIDGVPGVSRTLADLKGSFADTPAYEQALRTGNPVVYTVSSVSLHQGSGDLHYGLGVLHPGTVGREYYLTRGHLHSRREAAEVYLGLKGEGRMLLEDETTGESTVLELLPNSIVYVPAHTAHRTINVGSVPLVYIGIYPADAGHDYEEIARRNFRMVIVEREGKPIAMERREYISIDQHR
jgi:glucose-6-phosphate isomerase, archaeal